MLNTLTTRQGVTIDDKYLFHLFTLIKKENYKIVKEGKITNPYKNYIDIVDGGDCYILSIKFGLSHKRIKFFLNKDDSVKTFETTYIEKTNNIIDNIDNINVVTDRNYQDKEIIFNDEEIKKVVEDIFTWGITKEKERDNDIFKVLGINSKDIIDPDKLSDRVLYFTVIDEVLNITKITDEVSLVHFKSIHGIEYKVEVFYDKVLSFKSRYIYIFNYHGKYNVMKFTHAKKHLHFSEDDLAYITNYLEE